MKLDLCNAYHLMRILPGRRVENRIQYDAWPLWISGDAIRAN